MKKTNLLTSFILFNIIFISFIPLFSIAQTTDLSYTFDDNVIYENNNIELQESFNLKYIRNYTGLYNASYSFTNEIIGTNGTDIIWIDDMSGTDTNANATIISNNDNHSQVLNIYDNNNAGNVVLIHDYTPQTSGTIEFWLKTLDATDPFWMYQRESGAHKINMRVETNALWIHDGTIWNNIGTITDDTWYHLRIDFDTTTDRQTIYLNNENVYNNQPFFATAVNLEQFYLFTTDAIDDYSIHFDGYGESWLTNYTVNTNLFPYVNVSETLQEIDRYEFAMSAIDTFHPTGADSTNGWSDIEVGGGDKVGIAIQGNVNGLIYSNTDVINDQRGTRKLNLGINGEFINVSVAIIPQVINGILNEIIVDIHDSTDTFITGLIINADLSVIVSTGAGNLNLNRDVILMRLYDFNFFINYELDRCFLIYTQDGIIQEIYDYTLVDDNKQGLDRIEVYSFNTETNIIEFLIDYIGIYNSGISILDDGVEFGLSTRLLDGVSNWNYEHNNLVNIIANGNFHLGAVDGGNYFRGSTLLVFRDTFNYTLTEPIILNIYDDFVSEVSIPRLVFTLVSGFFNVSYFKIDGVLLNESSNSYNLIFEHDNININESYFYVEGSKLLFRHISNDTNLEFIQARFNINDVSSDGYSISYRSVIQNNAYGFFRINFTLTSALFQFPNIETFTRAIIPQNKTIRDFIILITDRDDNSVSGLTTGSIDSIQLLITLNIGTSIIISSLIDMMIPLIMILIPTLALSNRYGRNLIIPMFLLMSVICVVSALIPLWLFFVIVISSSLTLLKKRDDFV